MKQTIQDHLIALHRQHGTLTPELVVEDARSEDSPLHDLFEWDPAKAALAHWHDVARALIRNVRVVVVNENRVLKAPYFVRDPSLARTQQGYTTVEHLRTDTDMARDVVADECSRAAAAFRRAQEIAAAVGVDDDIEQLLRDTLALGQRVKQPA